MLFPPDFLTRLEYLSIVSKKVFRGQLLAQKRTMQTGSGIEFSDHREYYPGDDLRYLDWNVYARHGDLLLKRFQEEQDLHVWLMLDCSPSMMAGTPTKFDLARQLTAALAYIALADLDRVAVIAWAAGLIAELPVHRGKAGVVPIMHFLDALQSAEQETCLEKAAREFVHRGSRRGLVVLISDLFDEQGFHQGLDLLRYNKFDVHVIQLHASEEADPDLLGEAELVDMETGSIRKVTISERHLQAYRRRFMDHQTAVKDYCRKHRLGCTQSSSVVRFDRLIMSMMKTSGAPD